MVEWGPMVTKLLEKERAAGGGELGKEGVKKEKNWGDAVNSSKTEWVRITAVTQHSDPITKKEEYPHESGEYGEKTVGSGHRGKGGETHLLHHRMEMGLSSLERQKTLGKKSG